MFDLSLEVLRVVEDAAIASARTMGMGDPDTADRAPCALGDNARHCEHIVERVVGGCPRCS